MHCVSLLRLLGFSRSFSVKVNSDPEVRIGLWRLTPLSWRRGRFPWFAFLRFSICSTLIRWSSYCTCKAVGDSRAPTVAALTRSLTCPLCSTTARVQRAENCSGPAVVARFSGGRRPCCAGRVGAAGAFAVVNVPVIIQRQVSSLSMWRCLRFSSPAESWTFPLCNRDWYEALWWR